MTSENAQPSLRCRVVFPTLHLLPVIHLNDECKITNAPSVCPFRESTRKLVQSPQNIKSPITSQIQRFQNNLRANCRDFSYWLIFFFQLMVIHAWCCDSEKSVSRFICKFATYIHTFLCVTFPCHRTKKNLFLYQVSLKLCYVVFPWYQQKSWIRTYLCSSPQHFRRFDILFEYNPNTHGQEKMLDNPSDCDNANVQVGTSAAQDHATESGPKDYICVLSESSRSSTQATRHIAAFGTFLKQSRAAFFYSTWMPRSASVFDRNWGNTAWDNLEPDRLFVDNRRRCQMQDCSLAMGCGLSWCGIGRYSSSSRENDHLVRYRDVEGNRVRTNSGTIHLWRVSGSGGFMHPRQLPSLVTWLLLAKWLRTWWMMPE